MDAESTLRLISAALLAAFCGLRAYYSVRAGALGHSRLAKREGRLGPALRLATGIPGCVLIAIWLVAPSAVGWSLLDLPLWLRWAGAVLALIGNGLLWWVHRTLDVNFSPTLWLGERHRLATSGPYRRVRHPMYTALLIVGVAVFLLTANWFIGFVTIPAMIAAIVVRIPREEAMLVERFGETYRQYARQTGLLLPRFAHGETGAAPVQALGAVPGYPGELSFRV